MPSSLPAFVIDPDDPRAPSEEEWAQMSLEERAKVVALLPANKRIETEVAIATERHRAEAAETRAETEKQRVETEKQRADDAEARLAKALAELEELRKKN